MSHVLFIENDYETERHFTHGFRQGALRSGWKTSVVWLKGPAGISKTGETLLKECVTHNPDLIVWIMDTPLSASEFLLDQSLQDIPKASLWFDDFHRTFAIQQFPERHRSLVAESRLNTFVWDGYWRKQFQSRFQIASLPIQLAADEESFFPEAPNHFKELSDHLIFIGNTPSLNAIEKLSQSFPQPCREWLDHTREIISSSGYARLPYESLQEALDSQSPKQKIVINHFLSSLDHRVLTNHIAWMMAKRETRLRILQLAAQQSPLCIFSGHSDPTFMRAKEWNEMFAHAPHPVRFVETSHLTFTQLGSLYQAGKLHLQATDPQSVEGGLPFRTFETAACQKPLLTDYKPELSGCFTPDTEIFCYQNDKDFPDVLSRVLNSSDRDEVGRRARNRFLTQHTWTHRFQTLISAS